MEDGMEDFRYGMELYGKFCLLWKIYIPFHSMPCLLYCTSLLLFTLLAFTLEGISIFVLRFRLSRYLAKPTLFDEKKYSG